MGCKEAVWPLENLSKSIIPHNRWEESKEIGPYEVIKRLHGWWSINSPLRKLISSTHPRNIGFLQVYLEYKGYIRGTVAYQK